MMSAIPRVMDHFFGMEKLDVTFVQPTVENGLLTAYHEIGSAKSSISIMIMRLPSNTVVPFQVRKKGEIIYIAKGPGICGVIEFIGGQGRRYNMVAGNQLTIQPGCPHSMAYFPDHGKSTCEVLVISSLQDPKDIQWEDGVDELVKNNHRKHNAPDKEPKGEEARP